MPRGRTRFDLPWPSGGLIESTAYESQPRESTVDCQNVRAYEPSTGRSRGGQRAGLVKHADARTADGKVQTLGQVVARTTPSDQNEVGARSVVSYAVTNGTVAKFTSSAFTTATNGSSALSSSVPVIFSSQLFGVVYFADGTNEKKWTASTNTVATWSASAGSLPTQGSNKPRLIETWRGRIVCSGISTDPHNWFMSKVGDADDWNYSPTTATRVQAVAGNQSEAGKSSDIINALCPYSDDILLIFGDHSIWQMTGDPAEGGRLDLVTDTIGSTWGRPYCKSPEGTLYFFSNQGGVYSMAPGKTPVNISDQFIAKKLDNYDPDTTLIQMVWSDVERGFYLYLTPLAGGATTNYFFDVRNNSWWPDKFATNGFNPTSVHLFDGDSSSDRTVLLGCQDGYVRKYDWSTPSKNDDGVAIDSYVWAGPIQLQNKPKIMLTEMQATLDTGSNDVAFSVYAAESAQAAKASSAKFTGSFSSGRNKSERRRATGHNIFVKLGNSTSNQTFSYEYLNIGLSSFSGPRSRQW